MPNPARFLGFAFANADMLLEVDPKATVTFVTGAVSEFTQNHKLVGLAAARLFEAPDGVKFTTLVRSLPEGGRAGPLMLKLANGNRAQVALCRLPQTPSSIACTFARPGPRGGFGNSGTDSTTGLPRREGLIEAANAVADGNHALTLVDVPNLPDACAKLPAGEADRLLSRIGDLVRDAGPAGAGRVSPTTFGAVNALGTPSRLGADIAAALEEAGLNSARVAQTLVTLSAGGLRPEQRLLALNHVISKFVAGTAAPRGEDIAAAFEAMVADTQARAVALTDCVLAGKFDLAFQPVLRLNTMRPDYYEALSRFTGADDTGETVAFAETMGISDAFDVAVAAKVLQVLQQGRDERIGLNLSGQSFCTPSVFGLIAGVLASKRHLAPRLHIELTESAAISDLTSANQAVQALREMGFKVGLDDFGAGAASFNYLHAFEIDFVKFDKALIARLGSATREDSLIAGLVKLCREMKVETIAEGIEDQKILDRVKALGFDLGQGWHLGRPAARPGSGSGVSVPMKARRKGELTTWE